MKLYLDTSTPETIIRLDETEYRIPLGNQLGAAIVNTLADQLEIPLYKSTGERVPIILPDYGRPANITLPKK